MRTQSQHDTMQSTKVSTRQSNECIFSYCSKVQTSYLHLWLLHCNTWCTQVDSSCYAIPRPEATRRWVAQTPPGFTFHFKAFGMLATRAGPANALPREVRPQPLQQGHVTLEQLPAGCEEQLWSLFHAALEPVIKVCNAFLCAKQACSRPCMFVCRRGVLLCVCERGSSSMTLHGPAGREQHISRGKLSRWYAMWMRTT